MTMKRRVISTMKVTDMRPYGERAAEQFVAFLRRHYAGFAPADGDEYAHAQAARLLDCFKGEEATLAAEAACPTHADEVLFICSGEAGSAQ